MKNKKNYLISIGSLAAIAVPVVAVVSCGSDDKAKPEAKHEYVQVLAADLATELDKVAPVAAAVNTVVEVNGVSKDLGKYVENVDANAVVKTVGSAASGQTPAVNTVLTVNDVDVDLGAHVQSPTLTVTTTTPGKAEVTLAQYKDALKVALNKYKNKEGKALDLASVDAAADGAAALTAAKAVEVFKEKPAA